MTRLAGLLTGALALAACDGAGREAEPERGDLTVALSTTASDAGLEGQGEGTVVVEGEVTAIGYAAQTHVVAGGGDVSQGLQITDDDGEVWALGYAMRIGDTDVGAPPSVEVGDEVTLTVRVEMPWGTYEGVMLEDDAGLVLGGVNGRLQDFGLEDHLEVEEGAVVGGVFEHSCGEGQRMELDVSADSSASVATGESGTITMDGASATFYNLGVWQHQDAEGLRCEDWSAPYRWAVQR